MLNYILELNRQRIHATRSPRLETHNIQIKHPFRGLRSLK
jgi:hypothetical protein